MSSLRELAVDRQVALLFVVVFGLLLLATAAAIVWVLKHEDDERADTVRRDLRALWVGGIVFWLAWISGPVGATLLFGSLSFLALRELITLVHTRRGDHRSLILAFFVILPLQYVIVGGRHFDLFSVFIPVYAFLAIPVAAALAGDPQRFLERNAKIQWGIMVCVYGLSHVPALLLLEFPGWRGNTAFLVFFLVLVVQTCMLVQHLAARGLRRPVAPAISDSFHWRSWGMGLLAGGLLGALLAGLTPFKPLPALAMALVACVAGTLGHVVMKAIKRDRGVTHWGGASRSVTGAAGLLDRVDALCLAAPVFFHSVRWTFQL